MSSSTSSSSRCRRSEGHTYDGDHDGSSTSTSGRVPSFSLPVSSSSFACRPLSQRPSIVISLSASPLSASSFAVMSRRLVVAGVMPLDSRKSTLSFSVIAANCLAVSSFSRFSSLFLRRRSHVVVAGMAVAAVAIVKNRPRLGCRIVEL